MSISSKDGSCLISYQMVVQNLSFEVPQLMNSIKLGVRSHMLTLVVDVHFVFLYFKILTSVPKCIF